MAVPVGGAPVPLHEWKLRREAESKRTALAEPCKPLAGRVRDRKSSLKPSVEFPEGGFGSQPEVETWLSSLSKEDRKLVLMTNKEFRALSGTNAETSVSEVVEPSGSN
jgi:hypothetical protein